MSVIQNQQPTPADLPAGVTVVIPTRNRPSRLCQAINAVRQQQGTPIDLVVLDDASDTTTHEVSALEAEATDIRWIRNCLPLGWYNNLQRAFQQATSRYICVVSDDNRLQPGHLECCVAALDLYPQAAFVISQSEEFDADTLEQQTSFSVQTADEPPSLVAGPEWLEMVLDGQTAIPSLSAVVFRSASVMQHGGFGPGGTKQGAEYNLMFRLAVDHDVIQVRHIGVRIGRHQDCCKAQEFQDLEGVRDWAMSLEMAEAMAMLLASDRLSNEQQRMAMASRLRNWNTSQAALLGSFVPTLVQSNAEKRLQLEQQIADILPSSSGGLIVATDDQVMLALPNLRQWPFTERDGCWNGHPVGDDEAILELKRLRLAGAGAIVFLDTAGWLLSVYPGFAAFLRSNSSLLLDRPDALLLGLE